MQLTNGALSQTFFTMEEFIPYDRTFNKDIAFLYELQRLEYMANNFAIEGQHKERLRTLKRWFGSLLGILRIEERKEIENKLDKCKPIKSMGKVYYDTDSLDELHNYLNIMNTSHKLQLTTRGTGAEASRLV